MSAPFFNDATRLGTLVRSAHAWQGTPFHANSETAGARGGVCCHLLVYHVYRECGLTLQRPPLGPPGHARFNRVSLMEPWLDACPSFVRVPVAETAPGDLLGFTVGGAIHHLGIALPERALLHAINTVGAVITPRDDSTWASRHTATWRPIA